MANLSITNKELFYDSISDRWKSIINNLETDKRLRLIFGELLRSSELKSKKFLEIGCGLGYFSERAKKVGARVTGVDIGPKLIKINKKNIPGARFIVASAAKLPFRDNSFDVVLSTEVIEHVDNQKKAIWEMCRVLKRGGILVVTTPNRVFKPFFDLLSFIRVRPYHGNEKWIYPWDLKERYFRNDLKLITERYFNFIYPTTFFENLEKKKILGYLCINYAFKFKKL